MQAMGQTGRAARDGVEVLRPGDMADPAEPDLDQMARAPPAGSLVVDPHRAVARVGRWRVGIDDREWERRRDRRSRVGAAAGYDQAGTGAAERSLVGAPATAR